MKLFTFEFVYKPKMLNKEKVSTIHVVISIAVHLLSHV